jgi:hypothetical protein
VKTTPPGQPAASAIRSFDSIQVEGFPCCKEIGKI